MTLRWMRATPLHSCLFTGRFRSFQRRWPLSAAVMKNSVNFVHRTPSENTFQQVSQGSNENLISNLQTILYLKSPF